MSGTNRRFVTFAAILAGCVALQACAVTTGGFQPSTSPRRSQYEMLRQHPMASVHSLMTTTREPSLLEYTYY